MQVIRLNNLPKKSASHEDPADVGVLKQILFQKADLAPGKVQMINWATLLPGKSFRPHYHEAMDEVFIIINGEVDVTVGDEKATLGNGDAVVIPERSIHTMKNLTDQDVHYIAIGISRDAGGKTVVVDDTV